MSTIAPSLTGPRLVLRALTAVDADRLVRIRTTDAVGRWWHAPDPGWPLSDDEPGVIRWAVTLDGEVVGLIQAGEELEPEYRHASIDLFLDPAVHGRGLGREAVLLVRDHVVQSLGHHRVTIDPAADNGAAIRCYTACGFRAVGVMRRYERDAVGEGWHDGLLMEHVVGVDDAHG